MDSAFLFLHTIHVYNMSYKVNIVSSRSAVMSTMFYWLVRPLRRGLLYYRLKHQPERERMSEVVVINHQIKWHFSAVTLLSADVKTHNTVYCVGLKATATTILSWKLRRPFISMKHKAVILPLCDTCILTYRKSFGTRRRDIFITVCTSFWYLLHVREKCLLFVLVSHISITLSTILTFFPYESPYCVWCWCCLYWWLSTKIFGKHNC